MGSNNPEMLIQRHGLFAHPCFARSVALKAMPLLLKESPKRRFFGII